MNLVSGLLVALTAVTWPGWGDALSGAELPVREIGPGTAEVGPVRVEKAAARLSFPATVNMTTGIVEYAVVAKHGKTHESVFVAGATPQEIHLAALLLGIRDHETHPEAAPAPDLRGDRVRISVRWQAGGTEQERPLEDFIRREDTGAPLARGPWIYNGSELRNGRFAAQQDGSIVAIIADPEALVNNPRPGREDDDLWRVNTASIPPRGTAVRITITREESSKANP
jgi:hypothetical protein